MEAREAILKLVKESTDERMAPAFLRADWLRLIDFFDVLDITLYYLSLQPDIGEIGAGKTFGNFFAKNDFEIGEIAVCWNKEKSRKLYFLRESPWASGPGPMGGTASSIESYQLYRTGFETLKLYFLWPESLMNESEKNWPRHKKMVEGRVFPKFRRKYNAKKLAAILDFAEDVCLLLRQNAAKNKKKK